MKLNQEVVVVLGAHGGLGSAFSRGIVREGGRVVLASRNLPALEDFQQEIDPGKKQTSPLFTDASKSGDVTDALKFAFGKWGKVGALVICVGSHRASSVDDDPAEALEVKQELHQSMVIPTFNAIFEAQRFFRAHKEGLIANTSSWVVLKDEKELPNNVGYGSAKEDGDFFLRSLLPILKQDGVRGTNLRPATINTPSNRIYLDTPAKIAEAIQPDTIVDWFIENFHNPDIPPDHYFKSGIQF